MTTYKTSEEHCQDEIAASEIDEQESKLRLNSITVKMCRQRDRDRQRNQKTNG